jgi:hypothetical protein
MRNCYHLNRYPADHEIVGTEIAAFNGEQNVEGARNGCPVVAHWLHSGGLSEWPIPTHC